MAVEVLASLTELGAIAVDWDRLAERELRYIPPFSDLFARLRDSATPFRMIVARDNGGIGAIACVLLDQPRRGFFTERKKIELPRRQADLLASVFLGDPDADLATAMLDRILAEPRVRFIKLGEVDSASGLYAAVRKRRWGWIRHESRWRATRRIIVFPASYPDYLAGLRGSTQRAIRRDLRDFAVLGAEFRTMTQPEQMRDFVTDAGRVADKNLPSNFPMVAAAREHLVRVYEALAGSGRVYGFVAYVNGEPCAYYSGVVSQGAFDAQYTGFDPAYRKYCVGTAILFHVLEYLIASRVCNRFDFEAGDLPYKARFATHGIDAVLVAMGRSTRPDAALGILHERFSAAVKPHLFRLIGGRTGAKKIRQLLRR